MQEFTNAAILPEQLTCLEDESYNPLEKKLLLLKHITTAIMLLILATAFSLIAYFNYDDLPALLLIVVPVIILVFILLRFFVVMKAFPKKGYLLREKDISYRRGLIFYKLTSIPFNRIQHVEVSQSFLEKMLHISSIKVFTAGGSVSDLSIPGLLPNTAHQLEAFLLKKTSAYE